MTAYETDKRVNVRLMLTTYKDAATIFIATESGEPLTMEEIIDSVSDYMLVMQDQLGLESDADNEEEF